MHELFAWIFSRLAELRLKRWVQSPHHCSQQRATCFGCVGKHCTSSSSNGFSLQSVLILIAEEPATLAKYSVATKVACSDFEYHLLNWTVVWNVFRTLQSFFHLERKYGISNTFFRSLLKGQEVLTGCVYLMPSLIIKLLNKTLKK